MVKPKDLMKEINALDPNKEKYALRN